MSRNRIQRPPFTRDRDLNLWLEQVADVLNTLPQYSEISTASGPESVVTASPGTFAVDVGSSATTFWIKLSGETSSGWTHLK